LDSVSDLCFVHGAARKLLANAHPQLAAAWVLTFWQAANAPLM
jgi:hypothetical protein